MFVQSKLVSWLMYHKPHMETLAFYPPFSLDTMTSSSKISWLLKGQCFIKWKHRRLTRSLYYCHLYVQYFLFLLSWWPIAHINSTSMAVPLMDEMIRHLLLISAGGLMLIFYFRPSTPKSTTNKLDYLQTAWFSFFSVYLTSFYSKTWLEDVFCLISQWCHSHVRSISQTHQHTFPVLSVVETPCLIRMVNCVFSMVRIPWKVHLIWGEIIEKCSWKVAGRFSPSFLISLFLSPCPICTRHKSWSRIRWKGKMVENREVGRVPAEVARSGLGLRFLASFTTTVYRRLGCGLDCKMLSLTIGGSISTSTVVW